MSRTSMTLKRLGVAALATVTMGAVLPALTAAPASAAPTASFTFEPTNGRTAAATSECLVYNVVAKDASGANATDTPTVTITLAEAPGDATNDVEVAFCGTGTQGTNVAGGDAERPDAVFQTTIANGVSSARVGITRSTEGNVSVTAVSGTRRGTGSATFADVVTNPAAADDVVLTPETSTVVTGQKSDTFTATVTDANGVLVQNATVTVTLTGGGSLESGSATGTSTITLTTNSSGQVTFRTVTPATGSGTQTVTVTIRNGDTDSSRVVFAPTGPNCGTSRPVVTLDRSTIIATGSAVATVSGLPANSIVELYAYTRPSTTFRKVREAEVAGTSTTFRIVPPANTRLYAVVKGCPAPSQSESIVLNVRTALSLSVVRTGKQTYRFTGDSLPARAGGLIVSLYRVEANGRQVLTSQTRANATNGEWTINRKFTGTGRFGFVVRTGQDLQNAPGASNVRSLLVF